MPAVEADLRAAGRVPLSWYDVLLELNAAPDGRLRMSELGQRTVLSRTRVSRVVDELAAAGLAERQPDQADGRSSFAVLTSQGQEALRRAWPVYRQAIHRQLTQIREHYPQKVGLRLGFDEGLAHRVEAGADLFLMPSQFEPMGLNQLYSLKYGTVPVVRAVGGLYDTITDCTPETLAAGTANGFRFGPYTPPAFQAAVHRALACYRHEPSVWRQVVRTGMGQDWSWDRSAGEYEALYRRMLEH